MIPLTNGIMWIIASDGNLWRIDEALYKKDKGVMFLPSGSVPQHGNRVYSVVRDAHDNEWVLDALSMENGNYRTAGILIMQYVSIISFICLLRMENW